MLGKVRERIDAQKLLVATANDIPSSRCDSGKTSAAYVNGTGPIPGLYNTVNRKMNAVIARMCAACSSGMLNERPMTSIVKAMIGRVAKSNDLRPKESIAQTAGHANRVLTKPNPQDAASAVAVLKPLSEKMVLE